MTSTLRHTLRPHLIPLGVLLLTVIACYAPALKHEFISSWDDYWYVLDNEAVRGFSLYHLKTAFTTYFVGNYAPLQIVSYMLDYTLWGLKPAGFIAGNIILHTANGLLLYGIVCHLQRSKIVAFLASYIFLFHPVQVESVVWISQRKNVLAMFFFLLALICYRLYRDTAGSRATTWYSASLGCFLLALLTKSVVVVFPLVLIVFDLAYGQKGTRRYRDKIPFFVMAAAAAMLTLDSQVSGRADWHGGTPLATLLTMLPVVARYLFIIIWPAHLSPIYAPPIRSTLDAEVAGAAVLVCLLIIAASYLYRSRRDLFFWYLLFFVGLLPVSQIVPLITLMNDRYLYFPMAGAAVFIAALPAGLLAGDRAAARVAGSVLVLLLLPLPYLSLKQSRIWNDSVSLWTHAVREAPDNDSARRILAEALLLRGIDRSNEGKSEEAIKLYLQALEYDPESRDILTSIAAYYVMRGNEAEARRYTLRIRD